MSASDYALIETFEAREYPGMPATGSDAIIDVLIDGCSLAIEKHCDGKLFVQRAITEDYTWEEIKRQSKHADTIWLRKQPLVSVTSITDPAGNTVDSDDYWLDKAKGALRTTGQWTIPQDSNGFATYWTIIYTAGLFASTLAVDANLKLACMMFVADLFKHPNPAVLSKSVGDLKISYREKAQVSALPDGVQKLVANYVSFEL